MFPPHQSTNKFASVQQKQQKQQKPNATHPTVNETKQEEPAQPIPPAEPTTSHSRFEHDPCDPSGWEYIRWMLEAIPLPMFNIPGIPETVSSTDRHACIVSRLRQRSNDSENPSVRLPISRASHESSLLRVFQVGEPACSRGPLCVGCVASIPRPDGSRFRGGTLLQYMTPPVMAAMGSGTADDPCVTPPPPGPCVLCIRKLVCDFVLTSKLMGPTLLVTDLLILQSFRNLVDEYDGYLAQHTLIATPEPPCVVVAPCVRFQAHALRWHPPDDRHGGSWWIDQSSICVGMNDPPRKSVPASSSISAFALEVDRILERPSSMDLPILAAHASVVPGQTHNTLPTLPHPSTTSTQRKLSRGIAHPALVDCTSQSISSSNPRVQIKQENTTTRTTPDTPMRNNQQHTLVHPVCSQTWAGDVPRLDLSRHVPVSSFLWENTLARVPTSSMLLKKEVQSITPLKPVLFTPSPYTRVNLQNDLMRDDDDDDDNDHDNEHETGLTGIK
jgi:hypothetical protein